MMPLAEVMPFAGLEQFFVVCCLAPVYLMVFGCMIVSPFIARSKGYAPYHWFFALHPVGLIVIANLAPLSMASTPEERERMEARARSIGTTLSSLAVVVSILWFVFLLLPAV